VAQPLPPVRFWCGTATLGCALLSSARPRSTQAKRVSASFPVPETSSSPCTLFAPRTACPSSRLRASVGRRALKSPVSRALSIGSVSQSLRRWNEIASDEFIEATELESLSLKPRWLSHQVSPEKGCQALPGLLQRNSLKTNASSPKRVSTFFGCPAAHLCRFTSNFRQILPDSRAE